MRSEIAELRRTLPAVDRLLDEPRIQQLTRLYGRELVRQRIREHLETIRNLPLGDPETTKQTFEREIGALPGRLEADLEVQVGKPIRRILNATGILLHTNLGRAPLPRQVAAELPPLLDASLDLELDLTTGRRGDRNHRAARLLTLLTGAEGALVVNNNAGALVLVLATLASSREVVVSRGELVEIGGSFRIPDILQAAGARLVEVGTTNRTREDDYIRALGPETALVLKVYPSNYRMRGFVASVEPDAMVAIGRQHGIPVVIDEGSGLLRPHRASALVEHPSIKELVASGCDLVCGSGDKLLGGPQAGLIVGRRELVDRCRRHPLYRAMRPDRSVFAALNAVLRIHLAGLPLPLDRLWPDPDEHRRRLEKVAASVGAQIVTAEAFLGGGSGPDRPIPGEALALPEDEDLFSRLRLGEPPVVGYFRAGQLVLDLRTVDPEDDSILIEAVRKAQMSV